METALIFKLVLGVIALAALAGTGLGLLLASARRLWRVPLIIFVLAGFGSMLIPPSQQLKLGPDLAGGTMLVYEVRVPQGADVKQTVEPRGSFEFNVQSPGPRSKVSVPGPLFGRTNIGVLGPSLLI